MKRNRRNASDAAAKKKGRRAAAVVASVEPAPPLDPVPRPVLSIVKQGGPARVGVISPAGRVLNHDQVVTYSFGDPNKSLGHFMNIGDSFVYDSSLKILDFSDLVPIYTPDTEAQLAEHIEQINSLDYVFLRGSNYINTNGKWDAITDVLEKTRVPIVAFGIGVQAPDNAEVFVNESTKRFLQLIADRSTTIGVRGELSQRALRTIGIRNTRIIGCPTAFRHRQPELSLRRVAVDDIADLGFTLRRNTHSRSTLQRYLIRTLSEQFRTTVFCAGELEEKAIYYAGRGMVADADAVMAKALAALTAESWFFGPGDPLVGIYNSALALYESVSEFEARIAQMSAVTGFRLHGNLLALANGIPALYVTYDSRTREFVDTLGIPFVESRLMDRFSFRNEWEKADFGKFERTYAARFKDLEAFLEENNMPHRLARTRQEVLVAAE